MIRDKGGCFVSVGCGIHAYDLDLNPQQAIYQTARDEASLRQANYRGAVQSQQGMQALAVDPNEHARATPPLDELLPRGGTADAAAASGGGGQRQGYEVEQYRVETEGYKVAEYRSIYDKP